MELAAFARFMRRMKKFLAAILMFALLTGQAFALSGSASAMALREGVPVASASSAGMAASLPKRVCWRKTLTAVQGDTRPLLSPPCGSDVKNTCEFDPGMTPATRQVHAAPNPLNLAGNDGSGLFRPPIA